MRWLCWSLLGLASCAAAAPAPVAAPASDTPEPVATPEPEPTPDAASRVSAAEAWLTSEPVHTRFAVRSAGAVESSFAGVLRMDGDRIELVASGHFAGTPVKVSLQTDGSRMKGDGGARSFDLPQPAQLRTILGVSIVRMGLLHTLAMLVAGNPPDAPEGDVHAWLVLTPQPGAPTVAVMEPHHAKLPADPITFRTAVGGDDSIVATVWIEDGVLLERQQETRFDEGTMQVLEAFEPL